MLRWHDDELGYVNPFEVFQVAERCGLTLNLSLFLMQNLASDIVQWSKTKVRVPPIAFNVHPTLVQKRHFIDSLLAVVNSTSLGRNSVIFELTEDCILNGGSEIDADYWRALIHEGYVLSLDDFGTGYSSLKNLKEIPTQEIKIDRSFVLDLLENKQSEAIVRGLLDIARETGKSVVPEGVETKEQLELLSQFGCLVAQGYIFSHAIPADEIGNLFKQPLPYSHIVRNTSKQGTAPKRTLTQRYMSSV